MSKIDEKYIDALSTFTFSLEQIVESLKEQQKANKADTVNEFLKAPMDNLVEVVADLKKVTVKGFAKINSDNKEILKKIESIKQQKESGMFDRVEDPKNKNRIVDGIKVVVLIAAGVLALGMAFKIAGKVDFASVTALSIAMLAMSYAFGKITDIKGLSLGSVFKIALLLPMMAAGLALSAYLLKSFPRFTFQQGLSIILVGVSLGLATYGIGLALKGMKNITWKEMLALPVMIPMIAASIVLSSQLFQDFIPIKNPMSLLKGSLVIGVAVLAMSFSVVLLGRLLRGSLKELEIGVLGSIAVAGAIVAISYAFQALNTVNAPDLMWTLKTGLALFVFSSVVVLIALAMNATLSIGGPGGTISGSIGGDIKKLGLGLLAVVGIAVAIVAVSQIMRLFADGPIVNPLWALGVGLSILILSAPVMLIGVLLSTGIGIPALALGLLALPLIALSMVAISEILKLGNWDNNFPSSEWALGVGGSLLLFSVATIAAAGAGLASLVGTFFTGGEDPLVKIAKSMVAISFVIQDGKWDGNYPKKEWSLGVGTALALFATATVVAGGVGLATGIISFFTGDKDPLLTLAKSMVAISFLIQTGKWDGNYPKYDWALGVGTAMGLFAALTVVAGGTGLVNKIFSFFGGDKDPLVSLAQSMTSVSKIFSQGDFTKYPSLDWTTNVVKALNAFSNIDLKANSIRNLADSFRDLSDSLKDVNSFDNLSKISSGLVLLSVIDDVKLQIVLDKIKENENTLKSIYGDNSSGILNFMDRLAQPVQATITPESILSLKTTTDDSEQKRTNDKLEEISNKLSQLLDAMNQPTQSGSFNK